MKRWFIMVLLMLFTLSGCYMETPHNPLVTATPTPRGMVLPPETRMPSAHTMAPSGISTTVNGVGQYRGEAMVRVHFNGEYTVVHCVDYETPVTHMEMKINGQTIDGNDELSRNIMLSAEYLNTMIDEMTIDLYQEDELIAALVFSNAMIRRMDDQDLNLKDMPNASSVENLWLVGDGKMQDLSGIAKMDHLRLLDLRGIEGLEDVSEIATLSTLRHFYLWTNRVPSGLDVLRNMDLISLSMGNVGELDDLSLIAHMKSLEYLNIENYRKVFGTALDKLDALRHVTLNSCTLLDNDGFRSLLEKPYLKTFIVYDNILITEVLKGDYSKCLESVVLNNFNQLTTVDGLAYVPSIKNLKLNDLPLLKSVAFLHQLVDLQSLHLNNLRLVEDINVIGRLDQLFDLTLWSLPKVENISGLDRHHCIRHLEVDLDGVDIAPLLNNPNLETLWLHGDYNLTSLEMAIGLQSLSIDYYDEDEMDGAEYPILDLSVVKSMTQLERLVIDGFQIHNTEVLHNSQQIKTLHLSDESPDGITDLSFVQAMPQLEYLSLKLPTIHDATQLYGLPVLKRFFLIGLVKTLPDNMAGMNPVNTLDFFNCAFEEGNALDVLGAMDIKNLYLYGCEVKQGHLDLDFIGEMDGLVSLGLDCSNTQFDLPDMSRMTALHTVRLTDRRRVKDFSGLWKAPRLEKLYLNGCKLGDLTPLTEMTTLRTLGLYSCAYDDLSVLDKMDDLMIILKPFY